jgi:hypothetical protein
VKPLDPATRALVIELDGGACQWPGCEHPATEIAHLHSRGMGGTPDGARDHPTNLMCACWRHARYTDGETGDGSWAEYADAHYRLLGRQARHLLVHPDRLAYARAEHLRGLLAARRSWADLPNPT